MILKLNPSGQTCGSCGQVSNACEHHSAIIDIILCPPSSKIVSGSGFSSNAVGWRHSNHWRLEEVLANLNSYPQFTQWQQY